MTNKKQNKNTHTKQPTYPAPAASTAGPCPTICQSSRTPRHWKLPSTIDRPNHPQMICNLLKSDLACIMHDSRKQTADKIIRSPVDILGVNKYSLQLKPAVDGCKKRRKNREKILQSMKADAATNINHNSVSKNIHTVSKFTLHSHDETFSNTWCVNVNILLHLVRPRCIFACCVNILTYVFAFTCAKYIPKYIYTACKYTYVCKFCACELHLYQVN